MPRTRGNTGGRAAGADPQTMINSRGASPGHVGFAGWLGWQGYLLEPFGLGGRDGAWAFANLGVLLAFLIGLLGTVALRRSAVRAQETLDR